MITVTVQIKAPIDMVWDCFANPKHIVNWNFASPDWHAPSAENDLSVNGIFKYNMAAKDGTFSFDFGGTYTKVEPHKTIEYTMNDGRKAIVQFNEIGNETEIIQMFDPENENSEDLQKGGWQAILNNFKNYTEKI